MFDYPILFARSVDGLTFIDNRLVRNTTYRPYHYRKEGITLEYCRNVRIGGNKIEGDVLGHSLMAEGMKPSDIKFVKKEKFFSLQTYVNGGKTRTVR